MIVKHINSKPEDNSLVFLAQSPGGTLLYDYVAEKFVVVEGFTSVGPHRCVYDKDTVQEFYSLHKAFHTLYPEGVRGNE